MRLLNIVPKSTNVYYLKLFSNLSETGTPLITKRKGRHREVKSPKSYR